MTAALETILLPGMEGTGALFGPFAAALPERRLLLDATSEPALLDDLIKP